MKLDSAMFQWVVEYAGCLLSRYKVGSDGQTAYERIKNKKLRMPIVEFGERVLCIPCVAKGTKIGQGSHEARYVYGTWIGIVQKTGEAIIGNSSGVFPSTSIRRLPVDERWSEEAIKAITATPWNWDAPKPRSSTPSTTRNWARDSETEVDIRAETVSRPTPTAETVEAAPRRVMIREKFELKTFGHTKNCPGCEAAKVGRTNRQHTKECRQTRLAGRHDSLVAVGDPWGHHVPTSRGSLKFHLVGRGALRPEGQPCCRRGPMGAPWAPCYP